MSISGRNEHKSGSAQQGAQAYSKALRVLFPPLRSSCPLSFALGMNMESSSVTPKTALISGMVSAFIMYFLGPYIDRSEGFSGTFLMLAGTAVVALPAYFFVGGLRKDQLVGNWLLEPQLLKRIGAWLVGVIAVATIFQIIQLLLSHA